MKETKEIVVEGFHAVKHAVRFKISCSKIYTTDLSYARGLISDLAPDLKDEFYKHIEEIDSKSFLKYTTNPVRTKIIGLFRLSNFSIDDLDIKSRFPIIVLEDPRDLNNIGAIARTSAAFGVSAIILLNTNINPYSQAIIRSSAGLSLSIPIVNMTSSQLIDFKNDNSFKIVAWDDEGEICKKIGLRNLYRSQNKIMHLFGSERSGISNQLLSKSDLILALHMQNGVSSLNLAATVAAVLYRY